MVHKLVLDYGFMLRDHDFSVLCYLYQAAHLALQFFDRVQCHHRLRQVEVPPWVPHKFPKRRLKGLRTVAKQGRRLRLHFNYNLMGAVCCAARDGKNGDEDGVGELFLNPEEQDFKFNALPE